jgi:hypothetical protein
MRRSILIIFIDSPHIFGFRLTIYFFSYVCIALNSFYIRVVHMVFIFQHSSSFAHFFRSQCPHALCSCNHHYACNSQLNSHNARLSSSPTSGRPLVGRLRGPEPFSGPLAASLKPSMPMRYGWQTCLRISSVGYLVGYFQRAGHDLVMHRRSLLEPYLLIWRNS